MKLSLRKDIGADRRAAIGRVNGRAGGARTRYITSIPGQDMIYLEKAAEARRFIAAYPTPGDAPAVLDPDPMLGYPFLVAEIGITAPDAHGIALVWVGGAAAFRAVGAVIETIRLGHVAMLEAASTPAQIAGIEASFEAALAMLPETPVMFDFDLDLDRPDDFRGDPYAWLTNEASHILLGLAGVYFAGLVGVAPLWAVLGALILSGAVEALHLSRGGTLPDSLTDMAAIVGGALWQAAGQPAWLAGVLLLGLIVGTAIRALESEGL